MCRAPARGRCAKRSPRWWSCCTACNEQIKQADRRLRALAEGDAVLARLRTVPGVGVVTATSFVSTLDEATRFAGAKQARASSDWCLRSAARASTRSRGLCEQIRRRGPKTPIVIFSGHPNTSDREAGMLAGANVYLVKPDIDVVVPAVKRLLEEALVANP